MVNKRQYFDDCITETLVLIERKTALKNQALKLFDENKYLESFFKKVFNVIYNYNLENINITEGANYPAIDLADKSKRLAIQITTQDDGYKVNHTLNVFFEKELDKEYDRLIIFVLCQQDKVKGIKINVKTEFKDKLSSFDFKKKNDILCLGNLLVDVHSLDPGSKIEELWDTVTDEVEWLKWILPEPEKLYPKDICDIIRILKKDIIAIYPLQEIEDSRKYIFNQREPGFIETKNGINKLSTKYFQDELVKDLEYGKDIEDFLQDPLNAEIKNDYFIISDTINTYYTLNTDRYQSFDELFCQIFDLVQIKFEDREVDKRKLLILLHNMYFNCDIGKNNYD